MPHIQPIIDATDPDTEFQAAESKAGDVLEATVTRLSLKSMSSKPDAVDTERLRLMNLPPEIRLIIFNHLTQTVAATSNLTITRRSDGLILSRMSRGEHASVFFFNTIIPSRTRICKKFSAEYTSHVHSQSIMCIRVAQVVPSNLGDLPWNGMIPQRDTLQRIRECHISLTWSVADGRGRWWAERSEEWSQNPLSPSIPAGWTPTIEAHCELTAFLVKLREALSPQVEFHFSIHIPTSQKLQAFHATYRLDVDAFVQLLADSEAAHTRSAPFYVRLLYSSYLAVNLNCPLTYWASRRAMNNDGIPHIGPAARVTDGPAVCFWTALMYQGQNKTWNRTPWKFVGEDDGK